MKLLVDECLSEELAKLARDRGHDEASHVVWIGKRGMKDWNLMKVVLEGDWILVTRNAFDFRGPAAGTGTEGEYADVDLHAGLICLNGPPRGFDLGMQLELFAVALDEIARDDDLVNKVLEITYQDDNEIRIDRYDLPADG
jgi:hypothetical protein